MSELAVMENGSKGFSLAARFFSPGLRLGAARIYYWCRHCDDAVDERQEDLALLHRHTLAAWDPEVQHLPRPFQALRTVALEHELPPTYALDLLTGMHMDVENRRYPSIEELHEYCYHVAGTVGLMLCYVMGVKNEEALSRALCLGRAMQLTNIARDVREDWERGRVYLPLDWLSESGLSEDNFWQAQNRPKLFSVVQRLIIHAEPFYDLGREGIILLPLRAAVAVTIASLFYREIGRRILRTGPEALETRMVVPGHVKAWLILVGLIQVLVSIPRRIWRRLK